MSTNGIACAYIRILDNDDFRLSVRATDEALSEWELTEGERRLLREEADAEALPRDDGPVMSYLRGGLPLRPRLASDLGAALNRAYGLPTASLQEPGYRPSSNCCPWGHPKIPDALEMLE